MTDVDIDHLRTWIGRRQERVDTITPRLAACYNAIFNEPVDVASGDEASAGIHWCLASDIVPMEGLGPDGHPARGGFLPPVPFPRRMWAGGKLTYAGSFRVGDDVTKRSVIEDVTLKTGRTGSLIFVAVGHEYHTARGLVLTERQDIVYREAEAKTASAGAQSPEPAPVAERSETIAAGAPLLFRYSAITFNGHRIHYDLDYVMREEGYPGLVFHGPLQASYLLRLAFACGGCRLPKEFSFRSIRPLFAGGKVTANAAEPENGVSLWFADQAGQTTMTAKSI